MAQPSLTVCIPIYNAGPYLRPAIRSVLSQTFVDLALLLFDDGSTDRSLQVAEAEARLDPRVRVFPRSHKGYTHHLNEALDMTTSQYFARMDADDLILADKFARQVTFLSMKRDCAAVGTQAILVDESAMPISRTAHPLEHDEISAHLLRGQVRLVDASLLGRTDAIKRAGAYDPQFEPAEGFEFLLRLGEVGRLANLPDHLYLYRLHPTQITVARYERQQEAMLEALLRTAQRRGLGRPPAGPYVHRRASSAWQTHVGWARSAMESGYSATARKHSRRALLLRPWSRTAWSTLIAAYRAG